MVSGASIRRLGADHRRAVLDLDKHRLTGWMQKSAKPFALKRFDMGKWLKRCATHKRQKGVLQGGRADWQGVCLPWAKSCPCIKP